MVMRLCAVSRLAISEGTQLLSLAGEADAYGYSATSAPTDPPGHSVMSTKKKLGSAKESPSQVITSTFTRALGYLGYQPRRRRQQQVSPPPQPNESIHKALTHVRGLGWAGLASLQRGHATNIFLLTALPAALAFSHVLRRAPNLNNVGIMHASSRQQSHGRVPQAGLNSS